MVMAVAIPEVVRRMEQGTVMVTAAAHSLQTERVSEAAAVVQTDTGAGDGTGKYRRWSRRRNRERSR